MKTLSLFLLALTVSAHSQDLNRPFDIFGGGSLAQRVAEAADLAGAPEASEAKLLRERVLNVKTLDPAFLSGSNIQNDTGTTFFSTIHQAIDLSLRSRKIFTNSDIDAAYGLPGRDKSIEVSLLSHPVCAQTPASLSAILGADYVPDTATQKRINDFVTLSNLKRSRAMKGDTEAKEKFSLLWSSFFSCLAYAESLSDPELSSEADAAYNDFLDGNPTVRADFEQRNLLHRAPGVLFGIDHPGDYYIKRAAVRNNPNLSADEKAAALQKLYDEYNVWGPKKWVVAGLFQFAPEVNGNVVPCLNQWNENVTEAQRPAGFQIGLNKIDITRAIVSPVQSFTAYCGVQKVVQGFNSQVNTSNLTGVHPDNIVKTNQLKAPQDRCVSLMMRGGQARMYAHFGPLRNSTQKNLAGLFQCVDKAILEDIKN